MDLSSMLNPASDDALAPSPRAVDPTAATPPVDARPQPSTASASASWDVRNAADALASLSAIPHPSTSLESAPAKTPTPQSQSQPSQSDLDEATARAIAAAQSQYPTRRARRGSRDMSEQQATASPAAASPPLPTPPPSTATTAATTSTTAPPKKRQPPKSASKKPPPKKRKTDDGTADDRSATPASTSGKTKPPGRSGKHSLSATPLNGLSPGPGTKDEDNDDSDGDEDDDDEVYCICRKPDNHTWMIGCDGGCDDWYHGKCVNMKQMDEGLIDKFICPVCETAGKGVTTWKPMCRRDGCRNPARLKKGAESKYCSDDCGDLFMHAILERSGAFNLPHETPVKHPGKARTAATASPEPDLGPLGGPIRANELRALVDSVTTASSFRAIGDMTLLTPPDSSADIADADQPQLLFEPYEQQRLDEIAGRKAQLRDRRVLLKNREKFVMMARDRATRLREASRETRDTCAYDPRLAWDEATFSEWTVGAEGSATLEGDTLDDGSAAQDDGGDELQICRRKKCRKHHEWQKIALHDVRFEEAEVGDEMRQIDAEETELRRAGLLRARDSREGAQDDGGQVEVVDAAADADADMVMVDVA